MRGAVWAEVGEVEVEVEVSERDGEPDEAEVHSIAMGDSW